MFQRSFQQVFWVHLVACLTIFSRSLHLFSSNESDAAGPSPLPPLKTPVITCTIVEMIIERALIIDIIVTPYSRYKVLILSSKIAFLSRTFTMVCLILSACAWTSFQFLNSISSFACFSVFNLSRLAVCSCFCSS